MTRLSRDQKNIVARETLAKEVEVASQIQKTLLPRQLPQVPGLELDAFYRPASIVGGDLYDVFQISPHRYCFTVADVSGKGVPASLVMSMLRTVIKIQCAGAVSAKESLIKVNDYLKENIPAGMFITVQLIIYDSNCREINLVSAGHNPMLLYRAATGTLAKVNPTGMPLGMPVTLGQSFEKGLEQVSLTLEEGDAFFIFTDGVTEATNREGQHYGLEQLIEFVSSELARDSSGEISSLSKALVSNLDDFSGFTKPVDDITFIFARSHVASARTMTQQSQDVRSDLLKSRKVRDSDPKSHETE